VLKFKELKKLVSKRRILRESVLKALFQLDFRPEDFDEILSDALKSVKDGNIKKDAERYLKNIHEQKTKIDEIIEKHLLNWSFDRVSHIARGVLRLGTYELLYENDIPIEVTLDEMVEITKKYDTDESAKFINGVLDRIAKEEAPKEKFKL
jgi:N utilization substance protein B